MLIFQKIPAIGHVDLAIIGAGSAGCAAALAAGDKGYKVAVFERYGFLGGTSTQMLDTFYGFYTPGENPKKIVGGYAAEVVNCLNRKGEVFLRPNTYGAGTGVNYNPEYLKFLWDQMLLEKNIGIFLHSTFLGVETNGSLYQLAFWTKQGILKVTATKVIDASGDAEFCHALGLPYETAGEKDPAQSMTTTFRMANVNLEKFEGEGGKKMLQEKMANAFNHKTFALPRKNGSAHAMNVPGCISTVAVKVTGLNALSASGITEAEQEGRKQAFAFEAFFRSEVPGYGNAKIIGLSNQIGLRETRRVYGENWLTKEACMLAEKPEDSVFLCGAPIEDHREGNSGEEETYWEYVQGDGVYGVPYGCIVPKESQNVWVVGRCFSASHDAHASCRSMAQTMSMGHAAGTASILALEKDFAARDIPIERLKENLLKEKVILEVPQNLASTGKNDW